MNVKEFFGKFLSPILWVNLLAMALVLTGVVAGLWWWLGDYTHHGESITVRDLQGIDISRARALAEADGLRIVVGDTGYNKQKPADCVLMQVPAAGAKVKSGRIVRVTINTLTSPTIAVPDLVDNSSVREAEARLRALGFKLTAPEEVKGEKDWVYGLKAGGKRVNAGDRVPIDVAITLQVGSGSYDNDMMDINYVDKEYDENPDFYEDDFIEIAGPEGSGDDAAAAGEGAQ